MRRGVRIGGVVVAGALLAGMSWAAFAPIHVASREKLFEIPRGTYARRMAGDPVEILPSEIRLTMGLQDILLLRNLDDVPQTFGPTIMMPGQSFRLPFERAARYDFICTAHVSGQLTIVVEDEPVMPWSKLRWRVREWWEKQS